MSALYRKITTQQTTQKISCAKPRGFAQLIFCVVCWVVIFRYKALIPLMYLLWLFEWSFRTFGYPLIREDIAVQGIYTVGATPGAVGAPYITFILIILFSLSLIQKK